LGIERLCRRRLEVDEIEREARELIEPTLQLINNYQR